MVKRILTGALLLFVAATLVMLVVNELRSRATRSAHAVEQAPVVPAHRFVAYYLFGRMRCVTCKTMGAYTEEALNTNFASQLADGALEFRTENFDAPGNERFRDEFKIIASSALLTEERDGKVVRWKNLENIWALTGSKDDFIRYITDETTGFINAPSSAVPAPTAADASVAPAETLDWRALLLAALTALGLGLLTAISPCPLATNVAAISFLGKRVQQPRQVLLAGLMYSLGRVVAYVILGMILVAGMLSTPGLASFLGKYINSLLGPLLVLAGLLLLGLLQLSWGSLISAEKMQTRAQNGGLWTAGFMGLVFALAFCPTSAALFFGGLIPLSIKTQSSVLLPSVYGLATGLPVVGFAILIAVASNAIGKWFNRLSQIEGWMRYIAGGLFLVVGVYYSIIYVFQG